MDQYTLIANSSIHLTTVEVEFCSKDPFKMSFREWRDGAKNQLLLDIIHPLAIDQGEYYFNKYELFCNGFLADGVGAVEWSELKQKKIQCIENQDGSEIYSFRVSNISKYLKQLENKWLPIPYFVRRGLVRFNFGPLNWSRFKMVPKTVKGEKNEQRMVYDLILAFDTRTKIGSDKNNEVPVWANPVDADMKLALCDNEFDVRKFCSMEGNNNVNRYLMELVHPGIRSVDQIPDTKKTAYIASYIFLINFLASKKILPEITLYKDVNAEVKDVDMVVDIGNSRTTALLFENDAQFNQVRKLELTDYTLPLKISPKSKTTTIRRHDESFDMRLAFRKVDFGSYGINNSTQFVYPSFVRLGNEANTLIHKVSSNDGRIEALSTYSSPKRYLWDDKPSKEEWRFLTFVQDQNRDSVLTLKGISNQLDQNGRVVKNGEGGTLYNYSRRSLMTFSLLEMLAQATIQINGDQYRNDVGQINKPRRLRRIIITCPTAMSKVEREALIKCANEAVLLLSNFLKADNNDNTDTPPPLRGPLTEVIPSKPRFIDQEGIWYYDEATCSQLVYMYGEVGHKYKGHCQEFFDLYGSKRIDQQSTLTVGSIDIGAGTSDMMIAKYSYNTDNVATITPEPLFFDSFYQAGDDMLKALVENVLFISPNSAFRKDLSHLSALQYTQKMKDFVGFDYNLQTRAQKILRRDFVLQYCVPLIYHMLEMVSAQRKNCMVRYDDVFTENRPTETVLNGFNQQFGIDLTRVEWEFDFDQINTVIENYFEPLLTKIAAIMYAYSVDLLIMSGRPSSLPPIRNLFLKHYPVSPDRLILLNNYSVGRWYPFSKNTDNITDPKTVVAVGAALGCYAAQQGKFDNFVINTDKLSERLVTTVNYIESGRSTTPVDYLLTPEKNSGHLTVNRMPTSIKVRQIDIASYPSRVLYAVDWNRAFIANKITSENPMLTLPEINHLVNIEIDKNEGRLPLKLSVERQVDNKETLIITDAEDKYGATFNTHTLELLIHSLGVGENYWLDSGELNVENNQPL